ncbi:cation diffusion facilitator family transporter [Rheinheimera maricola]|uniref:Cation diffusion facilitator family transporter n=1 Tax=Rheinheimera maricola TaxID=2793282 RepID=A0ABS7XA82_9GAMM|nr:cation diffusion facilitator family transporter [Rheinheimera maricola]MBZ9611522.1 cation diffusion facilitator family transporter [Rheinheimera maricola]
MLNLRPRQLLLLSLLAAFITMALKTLAWHLTGSVGFLSDAIESLVNVAGAGFALLMVSLARRPADDGHPYGHSKAEYLSAAFEGGLIFLAALVILYTAIERLINPQPIATLGLGTALTVLASAINFGIAILLLRGGKQHSSPALEGDGKHLMTDVWTTAGVIVGVALAAYSGYSWLDPIVAVAVALHIIHEGGNILLKAVNGLMDKALPAPRIMQIEQTLESFSSRKVHFINLRTRAAATLQFAQVDMQVPGDWSVEHAHQIANEAEQKLNNLGVQLSIHIEPQHAHGAASLRAET